MMSRSVNYKGSVQDDDENKMYESSMIIIMTWTLLQINTVIIFDDYIEKRSSAAHRWKELAELC